MNRKSYVVVLIVICIGMFSACNKKGNKSDISFIGESVFVNQMLAVNEKNICSANFTLFFVYSGNVPEINLIGIDGDTAEGISYQNETIIEEFAKNYEYEGYKVGCEYIQLDFSNVNINESTKIRTLMFDVEGTEIEVELKNELTYSFVSSSDINSDKLEIRQVANGSTGFPIVFQNVYYASKEMEIIDYSLGDIITFSEDNVLLDGVSQGKLEILPLKVKKDSTVVFETEGKLNLKEQANINVYTNVQVSYKVIEEPAVVYKNIMPVAIIDFDSQDDVDNIVEQFLNNR